MSKESKEVLNSANVMDIFLISRSTLQTWINEKADFPKPFKVGRKLLWKRSEIESYLESRRKG